MFLLRLCDLQPRPGPEAGERRLSLAKHLFAAATPRVSRQAGSARSIGSVLPVRKTPQSDGKLSRGMRWCSCSGRGELTSHQPGTPAVDQWHLGHMHGPCPLTDSRLPVGGTTRELANHGIGTHAPYHPAGAPSPAASRRGLSNGAQEAHAQIVTRDDRTAFGEVGIGRLRMPLGCP